MDSNDEESFQDMNELKSAKESPISTVLINETEDSKEIDIFDLRSHKIRISKRNRIMKQQLNIESTENSYCTFFSQEKFDMLGEKQADPQRYSENAQNPKLQPGSCFLWYILPRSAFKDIISDYEVKKCKKVFKGILHKLPNCHEAHFGLGKLLAHQGIIRRAQKHLKKALNASPNDKLYRIWNVVMQNTNFKSRAEALSVSSEFKGNN
jgi:tetratricopeptide (TPR) repeat protein